MRRRRTARQARERWVFGPTAPLARAIDSQVGAAAINPRVPRLVQLLNLRQESRYLDIGCGTSNLAFLLAARAGVEDPPYTMDIVPGPGPVEVLGWPEQLPFRDDAFDAISCFYFIHRFDDDVVHALGREIRRVLAPGGHALVMDIPPMKSEMLNRLHRLMLRPGTTEVDLRGWGRLAAMFSEAGFDAVDLVNAGPWLLPPVPRIGVLLRRAPAGAETEPAPEAAS